jgi:hypothetical protein
MQQTIDTLVAKLARDEQFRQAFQHDPRRTLRSASRWDLPLSDFEVNLLLAADWWISEWISDELKARLTGAPN